MDRKERVKNVYNEIQSGRGNPKAFTRLYQLLMDEIDLETEFNPDRRTNNYLHNLLQTRDKEADIYLKVSSRRPKKGAPIEYGYFIQAFTGDTTWSLW